MKTKFYLLAAVIVTALFSTACVKSIGKKISNIGAGKGYVVEGKKVEVKGDLRNCYWRIDQMFGARASLMAWICREGNSYKLFVVDNSTSRAGKLKEKWKNITGRPYLTYEDDLGRYTRGVAEVGPGSPDYYKGLDVELMPIYIYARGDLKVTRLYREVFNKRK